MNIGIVTTWFERGAAYVSKQFEDVLSKENSVFIYARGGEKYAIGDPKWDKENVTWGKRVISPFTTTIIDKKEFTNWIRNNKIEVVLFNEQRWWYPLLWCNEMGVKTVAYIDYYTEETIPLYGVYDALICNTKKHYSAFDWHEGAYYIPWGTDIKLFKPVEKEVEYESNRLKLFHSCGMAPKRKGTDLLLRSLEKVKGKNYKLIIHSQVSLKDIYPELFSLIDKYESEGRLEIIEKTVTAPGLYYMGDVYVYPSRLEGIGLTIAEAVSSGLGLIVPDCGPMSEFTDDSFARKVKVEKYFSRYDGYYWPQNEVSIQDLASCIDYYIDNRQDTKNVKKHARAFAVKELDWNKNSIGFNNLINELLKKESVFLKEKQKQSILRYEAKGLRRYNKMFMKFGIASQILVKRYIDKHI